MKLFAYITDSFTSKDRPLIFAFLAFSVGMFIAWLNYSPEYQKRNLKNIAVLKKMDADVRWKISGSFDWIVPKEKEGLISGDQIFTGDKSLATIAYVNKKVEIVLLPNSLVTIEEIDSKIAMNILSGAVEVKGHEAEPILIKENDQLKEIKLERGRSLQLEKNSLFDQSNLTDIFPQVIQPRHGEVYDLESLPMIKLEKAFSGKIQISKTADFSRILSEFKFEGDQENFPKMTEDGEYYLRLVQDKSFGRARFFKIKSSYDIVNVSPKPYEILTLKNNEKVLFDFLTNQKAEKELVLYKNNKILEVKKVDSEPFEFRPKEGGKIAYEIKVLKNGKKVFQTPKIPFELYFESISFKKKPESLFIGKENKANFSFKREQDEPIRYSISEILRDGSAKPVYLKVEKMDDITLKTLPLGAYQLRVNSEKFPSQEDLVHPFFISDHVGVIKDNLTYENEKLTPNSRTKQIEILDWKSKLNVEIGKVRLKENELILETTKNGVNITSQFIPNSKVGFIVDEPGEYCVALKAIPEFDQSIYLPTKKCFSLVQKSPFSILPKAQDQILEVSDREEGESYSLVTPADKKAVVYKFFIYSDKNATKLIYEGKSINNKLNWVSNRSGIFYFRYQLQDAKGRSSEMSPISRIVFPISPLSDW